MQGKLTASLMCDHFASLFWTRSSQFWLDYFKWLLRKLLASLMHIQAKLLTQFEPTVASFDWTTLKQPLCLAVNGLTHNHWFMHCHALQTKWMSSCSQFWLDYSWCGHWVVHGLFWIFCRRIQQTKRWHWMTSLNLTAAAKRWVHWGVASHFFYWPRRAIELLDDCMAIFSEFILKIDNSMITVFLNPNC